jgi:hypothetical protein
MASYTDDTESQKVGGRPKVVCVWCGGVIRSDAAKAAKRMCQPCFARMMREHSRAHMRDAVRRYASDR